MWRARAYASKGTQIMGGRLIWSRGPPYDSPCPTGSRRKLMAAPVPTPPLDLARYFRALKDPRVRGRCQHLLLDIITIALCAVIAGADTWEEVATFGRCRQAWLKTFLALPN